MGSNDGLPLASIVAPRLEPSRGGFESHGDSSQRSRRIGSAGDSVDEELLQRAGAPEQNLALVGEVAEERALRQAGARGNFGDRGLVVSALAVELEGRLLKSAERIGFPSSHAPHAT